MAIDHYNPLRLQPLAPTYVQPLLAPLHRLLIELLRGLNAEQWEAPTLAGAWRVRDIAAHLLDTQLRKLSAQRDGHLPEASADSYDAIVRLIDALNASGVEFGRRLSTRVLLDLLETSGAAVASFLETLDPHAPARFGVAWAGEDQSENWMDIGREYTEWWHHQMQIRDATGAPPVLLEERWLDPLLGLSVRALPRAYRRLAAPEGTTIAIRVASRAWTLVREGEWRLYSGEPETASASARMTADAAWRLFYNAPHPPIEIAGEAALLEPLFNARSVMVAAPSS